MNWEIVVERGIAWDDLVALEKRLADRVAVSPDEGFLLLSEPLPTYTGGRTAAETEVLMPEAERERRGIALRGVERGGRWTYHGPGQVLLFPIVAMEALGYRKRDVRRFVDDFRHVVLTYLRGLGLEARAGEAPYGVYVDGAKIASFGLAFHRGIVTHGVALYISPQTAFSGIDPCGVKAARVTSLAEKGLAVSWSDAAIGLAGAAKNGWHRSKS